MSIEFIIVYLLLGIFVGFMSGLLGIAGGGIMVPILTSIFLAQGVEIESVVHLALGTSMASMIITAYSSMIAHSKNKNVSWNIVKSMSFGIIFGTFLATFIASMITTFYLALFFALFMTYVSLQMLIDKKSNQGRELVGKSGLFFAGNGIGAISALVSIGGGSLIVPYLIWQNIDLKKAMGTSVAISLPISIASTLGYLINGWENTSIENYTFGFIYLPAVILICISSYFVAPYGTYIANKLPVKRLKKIFGVLLGILGIKMFLTIL